MNELENEIVDLKTKLISFTNVGGFPEHVQGPPSHELAELLTAADANAMVRKILALQLTIAKLKAKLVRARSKKQ